MPAVGCEEVAGLLAPLMDGLVPDPESPPYVTSQEIGCSWVTPDVTIEDVRSLAVTIVLSEEEVPDPAEAASFGMDVYVSDPRLEPYGGVALWMPAGEGQFVGGGVGGVIVPGLQITVASAGFGKGTGFSLEHVLGLALGIL